MFFLTQTLSHLFYDFHFSRPELRGWMYTQTSMPCGGQSPLK